MDNPFNVNHALDLAVFYILNTNLKIYLPLTIEILYYRCASSYSVSVNSKFNKVFYGANLKQIQIPN